MSDNGYVLAYRGAWSHPVFKDLREAAIWNFLYQNAFWKDGVRNFNGHAFDLKRGQIVVSVSFLARGFGMTEKGVRWVIQKLEKQGMVGIQGANKGTIITICNYDKYQQFEKTEGEHKGKRGANEGQTKGENKKQVNTDKQDNKINIGRPDDVSPEVWEDFSKQRKDRRATITQTVIDGIRKEATKANITLEDALREVCVRGWQSFKADWYNKGGKNEINRGVPTKHERKQAAGDRALEKIYARYDEEERESGAITSLAKPEHGHIQHLRQGAGGTGEHIASIRDFSGAIRDEAYNESLPILDA